MNISNISYFEKSRFLKKDSVKTYTKALKYYQKYITWPGIEPGTPGIATLYLTSVPYWDCCKYIEKIAYLYKIFIRKRACKSIEKGPVNLK